MSAVALCDEDPAFTEVWEIVKTVLYPHELLDAELVTRFGRVFGQICDIAPDGSNYDGSGRIYCPYCSSPNVKYHPANPAVLQNIEAPLMTHTKWDMLSEGDKLKWIESLLKSYVW